MIYRISIFLLIFLINYDKIFDKLRSTCIEIAMLKLETKLLETPRLILRNFSIDVHLIIYEY